ncbi:hypothetical protein KP79_PYT20970 [Mizuhopecten yessoensis]|uniref:Uncharacterized protein n=1 Tax=Mizuhopecten yessoensis TaxID=6573 RepID=A0A210R4P9_MIZYE|nr:hypothetical protein KP79_PYT20970 [Mizuhopecten yessoensis]
MDRDIAAALYFHMGFTYMEILGALAVNHRIVISLRTLKRLLSRQNLFRRKHYTAIIDIALFINKELHGSGCMHGYRWMHRKCSHSGMTVSRKVVCSLMHILDPKGIEIRKKRSTEKKTIFCQGSKLPVACRFLRQIEAIRIVY